MTSFIQQFTMLLPLCILGMAVIIVLLTIALQRNHFITFMLVVSSLVIALCSLYFITPSQNIDSIPFFQMDYHTIFYTVLVILSSLSTCIFSYHWLISYPGNREEFYLLVLVSTIGGIVLTSSSNLVSLFIGMELMSLPLFGLVGYTTLNRRSLEASLKYTILSVAASSFLLFGMALIYSYTGSFSFKNLGVDVHPNFLSQPLLMAGLGCMLVSFSFKLSLAPFHLWTPDVYEGAPISVVNFLSSASKIAIFCVLIRLFISSPLMHAQTVRTVFTMLAVASILCGNLMASRQSNIKRLLGYSSTSHLGFLLLPLIVLQFSQFAQEAVRFYFAGYLVNSIGLFGIISLISSSSDDSRNQSLDCYRGLFWRDPLLAGIMTVMMLSLAGMPITVGFIGKFYIMIVALSMHLWWLIGVLIVGSAIGVYSYFRVIVNLYSDSSNFLNPSVSFTSWSTALVGMIVILSVILVLIYGIYPELLIFLVK
ncbi:NADH-quinone oxidoreductase subunit NuoN [Candidatus Erwinia haradaeae]|uniref:NADH-quinone oxidoreductase subunit N n=1 Tax=Candidatus Erwinia haradaeae TaxID=1922217 RepID=A0A803FSW7_9GAMM|nr:NADH-quinone oxidoreductase subunit NuoN [Candidatus Erwinia haradaeae]VFP87254.1 NADH-quinone oxidoreductase subunit N [Candidatus Erwinia haradaeae]